MGRQTNRIKESVSITLNTEAIDLADELAGMRGMNRSTIIEHLVREEARRERIGPYNPNAPGRKKRPTNPRSRR